MPGKVLQLLFLLAISCTTSGQDYRILHWGIEDGLSQGINQKIIRDSEGFLWITSYEGVNRFDGKTFRSFYSFPEKRNSIKGTETTGLVEDSLHNIWIGSGNGLNRYDPVADSVITFTLKGYIVPIAASSKEVICFDISGEIAGYDCKTFTRRVIATNVPWHDDYVNVNNSWFDKKNNLLWMPAAKGFVKVDLTRGKVNSFLTDVHVNAIIHRGNAIAIGTNNGLVEMDSSGSLNYTYTLGGDPLGKVTCLAGGKDNSLWIGTEEYGAFIISDPYRVTHIRKTNEQNSIRGNKINSIYCDTTGIVWISVSTNGIEQFIPGNRFTHYSEKPDVKNNLSNNVVRCFIEDPYKNLWIATQGGGINIFNPAARQFTYLAKKNLPGLPFDFIRFMVRDETETAWIGTEKGMCRVNMLSLKTERISFADSSNNSLNDPYIEQIIPWINNSWLIATKEYGLFQLNKEAAHAQQLTFPGNKHVFYTAYVNDLLFVSVWDNDPKIFLIKDGKWQPLKKDITRYTITFVLHDEPAKKYWIGTLKGLLETDENLTIIRHYTRDDGLSNHYIYAMVMDNEGLLWIRPNRSHKLCHHGFAIVKWRMVL